MYVLLLTISLRTTSIKLSSVHKLKIFIEYCNTAAICLKYPTTSMMIFYIAYFFLLNCYRYMKAILYMEREQRLRRKRRKNKRYYVSWRSGTPIGEKTTYRKKIEMEDLKIDIRYFYLSIFLQTAFIYPPNDFIFLIKLPATFSNLRSKSRHLLKRTNPSSNVSN